MNTYEASWGTRFPVKSRLKSHNPRKKLGAHSYLFLKPTFKCPFAETRFAENRVDLLIPP